MTALLNWVLGTEVTGESLGTPNGVLTTFSGTLANSPVGLGRFVVTYTIGATVYTATDDGAGNIAGTHITSGSITYSTGAYSLTFSTAPDNGSALTGDYIYGTAGLDWRQELNRNTRSKADPGYDEPFGSDCKEVVLSNTGLSGVESVIIGIREWKYPGGGAYGWDMNGYLSFQAGSGLEWNQNYGDHGRNSYDATWEHYDEHPVLPLLDGTIYYWFYANQERIVVVAKVSSNYESAYLGFGRRFGNPSDYPYPLCVIGSIHGNYAYSSTVDRHKFIIGQYNIESYIYKGWIVAPDNRYLLRAGTGDDDYAKCAPYDDFEDDGTVDFAESGEALMTPAYVRQNETDQSELYMDLDGVMHAMADGLQSEDTLSFDGDTYRVFQNIFRTDYYEFMAVKEA